MPKFEPPECDDDHPVATMEFLESYDPLDNQGCDIGTENCTEWQERWKYACSECGRIVEIRKSPAGGFSERTVRESDTISRDPTTLDPVSE